MNPARINFATVEGYDRAFSHHNEYFPVKVKVVHM